MNQMKILNPNFLLCFNIIDREKDIDVYKFIESLIYGENNEIEELKKELVDIGVEKFVKNLCKIKSKRIKTDNNQEKRKTLKECMIEDYVIKNNLGKETYNQLNRMLFLKMIPKKKIILCGDEIVEIKI